MTSTTDARPSAPDAAAAGSSTDSWRGSDGRGGEEFLPSLAAGHAEDTKPRNKREFRLIFVESPLCGRCGCCDDEVHLDAALSLSLDLLLLEMLLLLLLLMMKWS